MSAPSLNVLPHRRAGCTANMVLDWQMLEAFPEALAQTPRLRHYDWEEPSLTFGYSQRLIEVEARAAILGGPLALCRRPTGGGVVDHRNDWTYALVIPARHPLCRAQPLDSYRNVHEALREAIAEQRVSARILPPEESVSQSPAACFEAPSAYDVVAEAGPVKIAGAAQKRSRHGLLMQGSIERSTLPDRFDWEAFGEAFARNLANRMSPDRRGAYATPPWPDLLPEVARSIQDRLTDASWNRRR